MDFPPEVYGPCGTCVGFLPGHQNGLFFNTSRSHIVSNDCPTSVYVATIDVSICTAVYLYMNEYIVTCKTLKILPQNERYSCNRSCNDSNRIIIIAAIMFGNLGILKNDPYR